MNTIKINSENVLMVAHRGVSGLETENSIPAFVAAGNRSYFGVETDVHVTKDGKFVVIHDDRTGRVAEDDIPVEGSNYSLLRKIPLKDMRTPDMSPREDIIIPSLEEYVRICKKYEKKCVLELKNQFEPADIVRMVEEIKEIGYLENMIFISFSFENMVELRKLLPDQELQYLTSQYDQEILAKLNEYHLDLDIYYKSLAKENVEELHANGHKVNCWTCDSKEDAEKLVSWGVDFITSNICE